MLMSFSQVTVITQCTIPRGVNVLEMETE
jgi:hypothetical protein